MAPKFVTYTVTTPNYCDSDGNVVIPSRSSDHSTVECPRCKRPAVGWPLRRPDICSSKDWAHCIRNPETIIEKGK